ncbi:hypothetical protein [Modestobacter sp. SSW1-42]|uniref:hypothetical protein n=1 Tax=Modestobacter sp. SSW1-42 TaxID=596372 RepID=UPI00398584E4
MLIALLVALGVDLIVVVAVGALVSGRRRWVRRRPGAFRGAVRAADGPVDGLGPRWRRGYGRWVRDVLVWTRAPFLFRTEVLPVDGLDGPRPARPGEVGRLGPDPLVLTFGSGGSHIAVAVRAEDRERALAPFPAAGPAPSVVPAPRPAVGHRTSPDV